MFYHFAIYSILFVNTTINVIFISINFQELKITYFVCYQKNSANHLTHTIV